MSSMKVQIKLKGPDIKDLYNQFEKLMKGWKSIPDHPKFKGLKDSSSPEYKAHMEKIYNLRDLIFDVERNFRADLKDAFENEFKLNQEFARDGYRALSNVTWTHKDGSRFSCTWRAAGSNIAAIRDMGEDYLEYYCSGNEGTVHPLIEERMAQRGWKHDALS